MPHGKLSVVVDSASNIKDPGIGGKRGSYCIITCGSQVLRSRTVEGCGRHPLFKTSFEFEIDRSTNELKVCVYNERGSSREGELVGYCTLIFKQVFYCGHKLPLTSYPMLLPSGNSAVQINMSLNFKMRPSPKTQTKPVVPLEHCSRPPVLPQKQLVGQQKIALDWGYDCLEDVHISNRQPRAESRQLENYTASQNRRNLPGSACGVHEESPRGFLRSANPSTSSTEMLNHRKHPNNSVDQGLSITNYNYLGSRQREEQAQVQGADDCPSGLGPARVKGRQPFNSSSRPTQA